MVKYLDQSEIFIDASVFAKFKPSKPLLRKMNLAQHIMSTTSIQESELALDLCSFLLRYHRGLDYGDFSDNPYCVQRLRRYEDFKCWSEIEDIALLAETNAKDMLSFKQNNESALQEILQHLERIVREYVTKDEMDSYVGSQKQLGNQMRNQLQSHNN